MAVVKISIYLLAFVLANFIVLWFGATGLIFTALFLIPFDFVMRCMFHEQWKGMELFLKLGAVVIAASVATYLLNRGTENIAYGSAFGFIAAQIAAGIFYQAFIHKKFFLKVNGSDAIAILVDSIVFQLVAFGTIDVFVSTTQFALKIIGGLFWYWVIFVKYKLHEKW
jgi:hypothetical protein